MGGYILTILNPDGSIRYESPSILKLTGMDSESYVGKSAMEFIHEEDRPRIIKLLDQMYRTPQRFRAENAVYRWRHKQGHWLHLSSAGFLIRDKGTPTGILIVSHDLTPYVGKMQEMEEQKRLLQQDVDRLQGELKRVSKARPRREDELGSARTTAQLNRLQRNRIKLFDHDLRTPLHTIQGYVELLLEEHEEGPKKDDARLGTQELLRVRQATQQLHNLIERLVELARYEEEDMDLHLEQVKLAELCHDFEEELGSPMEIQWGERMQDIEVYTDREKLHATLLDQAHYLIEQGSPLRLGIRQTRNSVTQIYWSIPNTTFEDQTLEHLSKVFSESFTLDAFAWGRDYLPHYLGKQRIKALGGDICIRVRATKDICWSNNLSTYEPETYPKAHEDASQQSTQQHTPDIIFIGSDPIHREMLLTWAESKKLSFHNTIQPQEVFPLIQNKDNESTSLILLDVLDTHFDGWQTLINLSEAAIHHNISPIVYAALDDQVLAHELGAHHCINKMHSMEEIQAQLESLFKK